MALAINWSMTSLFGPAATPDKVKFRYQGVESLRLTESGDLAVALPGGGELIHHRPCIYQEISGQRRARAGRFRVWREGAIGSPALS